MVEVQRVEVVKIVETVTVGYMLARSRSQR